MVELVIRAQKPSVAPKGEINGGGTENRFTGVIKDRSYMGGEVIYFVRLNNGLEMHVINLVDQRLLKIGSTVDVHVPPKHCSLLAGE